MATRKTAAPAKKVAPKKAAPKKAAPKKTPAKAAPKKAAPKKAALKKTPAKAVSPLRGKTVGWYVARMADAQRALAEQVAQVIARVAPEAAASIKWGQPVWEHGGPFAWMRAAKGHLSLGFWRGAELEDPDALLEGSGGRMRHLKLLPGAWVPVEALERLVKQALHLNASKGDPTSRRKV
jgi:hypothetical protein